MVKNVNLCVQYMYLRLGDTGVASVLVDARAHQARVGLSTCEVEVSGTAHQQHSHATFGAHKAVGLAMERTRLAARRQHVRRAKTQKAVGLEEAQAQANRQKQSQQRGKVMQIGKYNQNNQLFEK